MPDRNPNPSTHSPSDEPIPPSTTPSPAIPKTGNPDSSPSSSTVAARLCTEKVKSLIRKNLLASPLFPRFYADVVLASAPNSNEAKILAAHYQKIIERTNQLMANPKSCTHIKVNGLRCQSPALRGERFCYFHQRMIRTVTVPNSRLHHVALLESPEAIQASVMEVVNSLIRGTMELKRAELILRALHIAVKNSRNVFFNSREDRMVREVPDYTDPPAKAEPVPVEPDAHPAKLPAANVKTQDLRTIHLPVATDAEPHPAPTHHVRTANVGTAASGHVGTAAPGCPGGPEVSGRSLSTKATAAVNPTQPKPPQSDKTAQILQSHKHRAPSRMTRKG